MIRPKVLLGAGASALVIVGVAVAYGLRSGGAAHGSKSRGDHPSSRQIAAATLAYPKSSGVLPHSIELSYQDDKDRTRMAIELSGLSATCASGYRADKTAMKLTSFHSGRRRTSNAGEASVDGLITVVTPTAGVLAGSLPPVVFVVGSERIEAKTPISSSEMYTSRKKPDGVHESLRFRIQTEDLVRIATATSIVAECGVAKITLSEHQIADLREFVARMNPSTPD